MKSTIFDAILLNDVSVFQDLVEEKEWLLDERSDEEEQLGNTVLHLATKLGHVELVFKIIELRPSLLVSRNADGDTPLHLAVLLGDTNVVVKMLEDGSKACLARNNKNHTPFHLACQSNSMDIARIMAVQTEVVSLDELDLAISSGCTGIAGIMLERFPDLRREEFWLIEGSHSTVLHHACNRGYVKLTRILLGLDQGLAEVLNTNGLSPLHVAVLKGLVVVLKEFMHMAPSSFDFLTSTKETVFHLAARNKSKDAFCFMVKNLSTRSPLVDKLDEYGNTILHIAASTGCAFVVRFIVDAKIIDITLRNKMGFAAYELLPRHAERFELLSFLLRFDNTKEISEDQDIDGQSNQALEYKLGVVHEEEFTSPRQKKAELTSDKEVLRLLRLIEKNTLVMANSQKRNNDHKSLEYEMQIEALQNARNTITIVAVLIASVAFAGGINPPGGVKQDGKGIGKSTVGRTTPFKVFVICNNLALFISLCIVILLVSIIPYKRKPLKRLLVVTNRMMWVAVGSMATAYIAASWVTIPSNAGTRWLFPTIIAVAGGMMTILLSFLGIQTIGHWFRKKTIAEANITAEANIPSFALTSSDLAVSEHSGYFTY